MKKFFLVLLVIIVSKANSHAQRLLHKFIYEDQTGIVDAITLEEVAPPKFDNNWHCFDKLCIGLTQKDTLFLFCNYKNDDRKFKFVSDTQFDFWSSKSQGFLYHIVVDNTTGILDNNLDTIKIFPKKYLQFFKFAFSRNNYVFVNKSSMDIYDLNDWSKPVVANIKANRIEYATLKSKKSTTDTAAKNALICYGLDQIYVYDTNLKLIKTINVKVVSKEVLFKKLSLNYNVEAYEIDPVFSTVEGAQKFWNLTKTEGDFVYCHNKEINYNIRLNKKFEVIPNAGASHIEIVNKDTKKHLRFEMNKIDKKALIPLKYQNEINFEILDDN